MTREEVSKIKHRIYSEPIQSLLIIGQMRCRICFEGEIRDQVYYFDGSDDLDMFEKYMKQTTFCIVQISTKSQSV